MIDLITYLAIYYQHLLILYNNRPIALTHSLTGSLFSGMTMIGLDKTGTMEHKVGSEMKDVR